MAQAIRKAVQETILEDDEGNPRKSGMIVSFKAYLELSTQDFTPNASIVQLRSELQGSGVSLIDTPKSGRKNASDFMLAADMMAFAIDVPPPARIFLVSGDRDFAYSLGTLRNRGYEVVLIVPPIGAAPILQASANKVLRWRQDVLKVKTDAYGKPYATEPSTPAPAGKSAAAAAAASAAATAQPLIVPPSVAATSSKASHAETNKETSASQATPQSHQSNHSTNAPSPPSKSPELPAAAPQGSQDQVFASLIALLERYSKEGNSKPLRSATAVRLVTSDPKVYERAGATRWAEFVAVAEANGLVTLGTDGTPGSEWISLNQKQMKKSASKQLLEAAEPYRSQAPITVPASAFAAVMNHQTPKKDSSSKAQQNHSTAAPSTPANSKSSLPGDVPIEVFFPLIEVHKSIKSSGTPRPGESAIATQLESMIAQGIANPYSRAGVRTWKEYIALADKAGVARCRPTDTPGICTVQIHPKYAELYTSQITTSASKIVDTTINRNDVVQQPSASATAKLSKAGSKAGLLPVDQTDDSKNAKSKDAVPATPQAKASAKSSSETPAKYRNLHTSTYDPKATGQNVWNGVTYPNEFVLLVKALLDQRDEGRFYSIDAFLHKLLNKLGLPNIKKGNEFYDYLGRAEAANVIEIQPGFAPGTKHVRLHARLIGSDNAEGDDSTESLPQPKFAPSASSSNGAAPMTPSKSKEGTPLPVPAKNGPSASPRKGGPAEDSQQAAARQFWNSIVGGEDRERFWPLVGTLVQIWQQDGVKAASRSRLAGDVPKRYPLGTSAGWTGAWYQAHDVAGFYEYATLAAERGYIKIVKAEDRTTEAIVLAEPYAAGLYR